MIYVWLFRDKKTMTYMNTVGAVNRISPDMPCGTSFRSSSTIRILLFDRLVGII